MVIRCNGIEINNRLRVIRHAGEHFRFTQPIRFTLFRHLILGFHNKEELFHLLYGHRADGGPEGGVTHISILFTQAEKVMRHLKLELRKERGAHYWTRYQLVPQGDDKWLTSPRMNSPSS